MLQRSAFVIKILLTGRNSHPTEYLMFFCLGKKEAFEDIPAQLAKPPKFSGKCSKFSKWGVILTQFFWSF